MDGRSRRKIVNAESMLHAGLLFIQEGNWRPSATQIAERCKLSKRTFWSLFGSLDTYWDEVIRVHGEALTQAAWKSMGSSITIEDRPTVSFLRGIVRLALKGTEDSDVSR